MPKNTPPIKQKTIKDDIELLSYWERYKQKVDENPDKEEVVTNKGTIVVKTIRRPYLRTGFEAFVYKEIGIHIHQYIDNYKGAYDAYLGVVTHIRNEWEEDQVSGTLTGRYKAPNLVARLNGLVEKSETNLKVEQEIFKALDLDNVHTDNGTGEDSKA